MKYSHLSRCSISVLVSFVLISAVRTLGQNPTPDGKTVLLRVTAVDDHGRPITGLKQEHFSVFEKKEQLPITSLDSSDEPASIAFLFDVSRSFAPAFRANAAQVAYQFIETSNKSNEYLVIAFNKQAELLCGSECRAGDLKKALAEVVQMMPQMNTALFDACDLALTKLESSRNKRHVIIVFTDGQDNASKSSFRRLRDRIIGFPVGIYPIAISDLSDVSSSIGMEGQGILDELASVSGGKAYYPRDRKELHEVVDSVAEELSHQYTIGFNPAHPTHDNKWHSVKIKVVPPKDSRGKIPHVYLRYREGYYDR